MKKLIPLLICLMSLQGMAQQILPGAFLYSVNKVDRTDTSSPSDVKKNDSLVLRSPVFGLIGASNLNEESLKKVNASGKASFYFRPYRSRHGYRNLTIYTSYNVNASNNDSVLYGTLIFPEVGNSSFTGTIEFRQYYLSKYYLKYQSTGKGFNAHSIAPYFEFAHKTIRSDTSDKAPSLTFSTLTYTFGLKYAFNVLRTKPAEEEGEEKKSTEASLTITAYLSALNIPDEDREDYRAMLSRGKKFKPEDLTDNFKSVGIKVAAQVNNFGVFADFRHVLGSEAKIPLRELRGFHSNVGFTLNTEIFHLY